MKNLIEIETIADASYFVNNSGIVDMEFSGAASVNGFIDWVCKNCSVIDRNDYQEEFETYLASVGQNPNDYK